MQTWVPYALASAAFAGLTAVFGKVGVEAVDSDLATLIRTAIILVLIAAIVLARGEWRSPALLPRRSLAFLALSAAATGFSWLCYYRALQLGPASKVAPVDKLSVALVIALSVLFLGETLTWKIALGGVLIVSGVILLAV